MQVLEAAEKALSGCLKISKGEKALVVSDRTDCQVALALYQAAEKLGAEPVFIKFKPRQNHGEEPPSPVAAAMAASDVIVMPTDKSLSHTNARKNACAKGARVASMPTITMELFLRAMAADYHGIAKRTKMYGEFLSKGNFVQITSPAGTDLTFSIEGRTAELDTGILDKPGMSSNLPAGEAFIAPVEGTAQGILVFDGSLAGVGLLKEPLVLEVKDGYVQKVVSGGQGKESLERMLKQKPVAARNIGEFGIGTNDKAQLSGNILEDEKVLGTVHVALGANHTFGGNVEVDFHVDGIILNPTVKIDSKIIMDNGKLFAEELPRE